MVGKGTVAVGVPKALRQGLTQLDRDLGKTIAEAARDAGPGSEATAEELDTLKEAIASDNAEKDVLVQQTFTTDLYGKPVWELFLSIDEIEFYLEMAYALAGAPFDVTKTDVMDYLKHAQQLKQDLEDSLVAEEGTSTTSSSTTTSTSTPPTTSQTAGPTVEGSYRIAGSGGQFTWSMHSSTPMNDVLIAVLSSSGLFLTPVTGPSGWECGNNLPSPEVGTSRSDILCSGKSMMTELSGTISYKPYEKGTGKLAPVMASGSISGVQGPTITLSSSE